MHQADVSNINALGLCFTAIACLLSFALPRRLAVIPLAVTACYMTLGQVVNVFGLNFSVLRIVIVASWLRVIFRNENLRIKLGIIDKALILWVISAVATYSLLWQTTAALANRMGMAVDTASVYFLFRFLLRDLEEVEDFLKRFAVIIIPLAMMMISEKISGQNVFSSFGGVSSNSQIRFDTVRAQGPFLGAITAGTFGATIVPLFLSLWWKGGRWKYFSLLGMICGTVIMVLSGSGGPALAYIAIIIGLAFWPLRNRMRPIRQGIVCSLVLLEIVMKAHVWWLIARMNLVVKGDGGHRSELIEQAIRHIGEWWLIGTKYTIHWMLSIEIEPGRADITNEYLRQGVDGGLITMCLFIAVLASGFRYVGLTLKNTGDGSSQAQAKIWCLGVALLSHVVSFLSVGYFDQVNVFYYFLLAIIATICSPQRLDLECGRLLPPLWQKRQQSAALQIR